MKNKVSFYLTVLASIVLSLAASAQTAVSLSPIPQFLSLLPNGTPNAFGCVFAYSSGTTSPLDTYTDSTGGTKNSNPVILSPGGVANIWLQAGEAYTIQVKSYGGIKCSAGSNIYSINGIGGGVTVLTTAVPYSSTPTFNVAAQNQLFTITLSGIATSQPLSVVGVTPPGLITFQITQDSVGGHAFTWPSNLIGGCVIGSSANQVTTQQFTWNGTNATANGPCVTGNGPNISAGVISATSLVSTTLAATTFAANCSPVASSGRFRLCNGDFINWRNDADSGDEGLSVPASDTLNISTANGLALVGANPSLFFGGGVSSVPALIPSGTTLRVRLGDNSGYAPIAASNATFTGTFTLAGSTAQTGVQGSDNSLLSAGTVSSSPSHLLCTDTNQGAGTSGCGVSVISTGTNSSVCTTGNTAYATCTTTVTISPTQADTAYIANCSGVTPSGVPFVQSVTKSTTSITVQIVNGDSSGAVDSSYAELDCSAIHP